MSYRVIRVKTFDGLAYKIEDVRLKLVSHGFTVDPIVYHPQGLLYSDSVHGLKEILHEMLLACDEPVGILCNPPRYYEIAEAQDHYFCDVSSVYDPLRRLRRM